MCVQGSQLGIDLIVIDDGWFGERDDDTSSLGDWEVNRRKFPLGLDALSQEVNSMNCRLGIWFEPEMVSENSRLFESNPKWHLHVPGRPKQLGRNQMVLDLSREDVREYLFMVISRVLSSAKIDYVKWDMNRPLTEVFSLRAGDNLWQSETSHRYVLGLYELQGKITKAFPHVLLENCASGGMRAY